MVGRREAGTVLFGRGDHFGDGGVQVAVVDRRAAVGSPELGEHAVERGVVQLGEPVEPRDAAGLRVVIAAGAAG
jgi:hypothetical protein